MRPLSLAVVLLAVAPVAAQPSQLTAEAIKRIKGTTVYIRVKVPQGLAVGSGFLVRKDDKTGYVATNDHVAAPTSGKRRGEGGPLPVQGLQVVFNSGTPQEWTAAGVVVARDYERDLACVRFAIPKGKELPEPMSVVGVKATETMPVYICGFPFGESLAEGDKNPEISIGPASVSSVRSDDRGEIQRVQINGALNPGNSGGPVVNAEGKLVGVAVTTIVGAGLGFAVPQHMVKQMMDGRVSEPQLVRSGNGGVVAVSLVVDPLGKVKPDKVWVGPVTDATKRTVANVSELPKAFSALAAGRPAPAVNGELKLAVAEFPLAANVSEAWVQSAWKEADGTVRKGLAHRAHFTSFVNGLPTRPPAGGGGPGSDDDGSPGGLPREFFEGVPGLPPMPAPPTPPGGPFAGPGGPNRPFGMGPKRVAPRAPRPPAAGPAPFGAVPNPGMPGPAPSEGAPQPGLPGPSAGPPTPALEADSLKQLDRIASEPARTVGSGFVLVLQVAGVDGARLLAFRPDGAPLVGLRLELLQHVVAQVRDNLARRGGGRHKATVGFTVTRYDPAANEAVGQANGFLFEAATPGSTALGGTPAEAEEATPSRPATQPQAVMSAPPTDAPSRPAPAADDGINPTLIYIAGGLMVLAVLGIAGVGVAAMYAGKPVKKAPKRRPARDWDDEDEDDDRPRRRR